MSTRSGATGAGRVRSKVTALALAVGLAVPGALMVMTPSAGAQTTDPLGPTIAQLEASYAAAVANAQATFVTLENVVEDAVYGNVAVILLEQLFCSLNEPGKGSCL